MPRGPFDRSYAAGLTRELPPERGPAADELGVRAAPAEPLALRGAVLTPDRHMKDAYVVLGEAREIAAVQTRRPEGVKVRETDGVILPGLIDLHGHPEFNVFAAWEPPRLYPNRHAWRDDEIYEKYVKGPENELLAALPRQTQLRYAEIRALVGGVTAIQGTSENIRTLGPGEALVRNVDRWIFGEQRGRALIDLPSGSRGMSTLRNVLAEIEAGGVRAFYLHLAEGRRDNERSVREFDRMVELDALTKATVVIHGTAFAREQFDALSQVGAKLVWSPQSNLRLYAQTTLAAEALAAGVLVALGADWLPSGSTSLLAELKVARRCLVVQGWKYDPRKLVRMVTSEAAQIAALDDRLGKLVAGHAADLVVLERRRDDPFENVVEADPSWVELVMVDGDLAYGREDWLLEDVDPARHGQLEALLAWGKPMRLDTTYMRNPGSETPPTLAELRKLLIGKHPQVGPVFA